MTNELGDQRRSWRDLYAGALTFLSPGLLSGAVCGGLIGGVGGRLAMLILRLTSDDSLHGMKTDDDFTIGSFTGETVFLLLLTTFAGTLGGVLYVGVREWLPERWRPILFGLSGQPSAERWSSAPTASTSRYLSLCRWRWRCSWSYRLFTV